MRRVSQGEQDAALAVLRRHEAELRSRTGAHYLDVGYKFINGAPTDQLAIRVHVHDKRPEAELTASELAPDEMEGVPVDVIQSRPEPHQNPRKGRFNPVVGGVAIRNTRHTFWGTLGMVVSDTTNGTALGLSNHHVLVGDTGMVGDSITQPNTTAAADIVGTLARWDVELDCAVFSFNNSRVLSNGIVDYPAGPTSLSEPLVGLQVTKSALTTGTTFGIIEGISAQEFTVIPDPTQPAVGGEISDQGDSGSIWLTTDDMAAVGLNWGGETDPSPAAERAWAKRITHVARVLNFRAGTAPPRRSTDDARPSVAAFGRYPSRNIKSLYAVTMDGRLAEIWDAVGWHIDFPAEMAGEVGLQFEHCPAVFGRDPALNTKSLYAVTTTGRLAQIWDTNNWNIDFPAEATDQPSHKFKGSPAVFGRDPTRNTKSLYAVTTNGRLAQIWDDAQGWHIDFPAENAGQPGLQFEGSPAVFGRDPARNTKSLYAVTTNGRLAQIWDDAQGWHIDFPAEATDQPSHKFKASN
jgi:hypothetical protein